MVGSLTYCMDCMEYMANLPDKAFELAIVDPPYGISATTFNMGTGSCVEKRRKSLKGAGKLKNLVINNLTTDWDKTALPP